MIRETKCVVNSLYKDRLSSKWEFRKKEYKLLIDICFPSATALFTYSKYRVIAGVESEINLLTTHCIKLHAPNWDFLFVFVFDLIVSDFTISVLEICLPGFFGFQG